MSSIGEDFELTGLEAIEREKRLLNERLHSSVCQSLFTLSIASRLLLKKVQSNKTPDPAALQDLQSLVDQATAEIGILLRELNPVSGKGDSLFRALEELAGDIKSLIHCEFVCEPMPGLTVPQAQALHRITQEAVRNVLKHAAAFNVTISLSRQEGEITLVIKDDGCGFDNVPSNKKGGINIMKMHAAVAGLEFSCTSEPGQGTTIKCVVPKSKPLA